MTRRDAIKTTRHDRDMMLLYQTFLALQVTPAELPGANAGYQNFRQGDLVR